MVSATYAIKGMTCGHCADAVSGHLSALPGVSDVRVEVAAGTATVVSEHPLDTDAVRSAVDEAGYEVTA